MNKQVDLYDMIKEVEDASMKDIQGTVIKLGDEVSFIREQDNLELLGVVEKVNLKSILVRPKVKGRRNFLEGIIETNRRVLVL